MKSLIAAISLLIFAFLSLNAKQPNVLLIVSDDMGWGDIGYVNPVVKTPNLDKLAYDGVRLERFYANPTCSVTRSALLSGRASLVTGVSNQRGLPLKYPVMAEFFHNAGYATWMIGKWHLGGSVRNHFNTPEYLAHNRGFDHFYGHLGGTLHYVTHTATSSQGPPDWWRNGKAVKEEGFQTKLLTDEAIELIKGRQDDKPFFLYLAYHTPHAPLSEPPSGMERYQNIESRTKRLLYSNITFMDTQIGRVIDLLSTRGELENTLVLFFNDNGGIPRSGSSNLPLRSQKGTVYEGGIRVRAFAHWPDVLPEATINYQFMCVMDLFPTLASAADIELRDTLELDGHDLWQSLVENRETNRPDFVMGNSDIAVFRPPWKLVIPASRSSLQLFDVVDDPYEKKSLIGEFPDIARELKSVGQAMIEIAEVSPQENAGATRAGRRKGRNNSANGRPGAGGGVRQGGPRGNGAEGQGR